MLLHLGVEEALDLFSRLSSHDVTQLFFCHVDEINHVLSVLDDDIDVA